MKNTVLRFGGYGSLILLVLFLIQFAVQDKMGYETAEVVGYLSIIIALLFVYFAIRHFRDKENNGKVSLGKAISIGLLVSLMASLTFGILNYVYIEFINPDFTTEYYDYQIEKYREALSEADFLVKKEQMETEKELFTNPYMSSFVMFATVLTIGIIMSLISGLILQRKN